MHPARAARGSEPARVAIVCDLREERWSSMDLVADMLLDVLRSQYAHLTSPHEVRPSLVRRFSGSGSDCGSRFNADRLLTRMWDYPRHLRNTVATQCALFHIVDHSYSQLVHALPARRTIVTCHDVDTFRSVLDPAREPRSLMFKAMTRRILSGFRSAARVTCDSRATRDDVLRFGLLPSEKLIVVPNGVHPSCSPDACQDADQKAARLLDTKDPAAPLILHVGSTIPRKRIEVLLEVFARVRLQVPNALLARVGGALTAQQADLVRKLGIGDAVTTLPSVSHELLAAVYRRAAIVLQPSSAEGFGLPVAEAMACGTPVIASDIPVLREVGGGAATYCSVGDVGAWSTAVIAHLTERTGSPDMWRSRRTAAVAQAAQFTWTEYGRKMVEIYRDVLVS
jgi:glycosyltransferase involved in cell wall biosynthesis